MSQKKILIVDDELGARESLKIILKGSKYDLLMAASGKEALKLFEQERPHITLLDIIMPHLDGLKVLEKIKRIDAKAVVIMITAAKSIKTAVEAMKLGAYDYITKPFNVDEIRLIVKKAFSNLDLVGEVEYLRAEIGRIYGLDNIVGKTKVMKNIFSLIKQVADSKLTVLIQGESGTGKELVAKAVHFNSSRKNKPFIDVNCAAIPDTLMESELFGHQKGAFTGAYERKLGRFELANGGTLFLDEIGDLSLSNQSKILRFLQERQFTTVGGSKPVMVDVRVIAATNKNLEKSMRDGSFRDDLYYRMNVFPIFIPPLRERKEDIPLLVNHFIRKSAQQGKDVKGISHKALELLINYHWPGNVRELENVVERAVALCSKSIISPGDLPQNTREGVGLGADEDAVLEGKLSFDEAQETFERNIILKALEKANYVQSRAAELLGVSRRILKYKIDRWGIKIEKENSDIA